MKTGNTAPVKSKGGGAGPIGGGGAGPIGGGPRSQRLLKKLANQLVGLAKTFETLAETPFGGAPKAKVPAKKK